MRRVAASQAVLPSGRSVAVQADANGEFLEIRSPGGEIELRVALTADGPILRLSCARLELASSGEVAMNCRSFDLRTAEDIRLNGRKILLNCKLPEEAYERANPLSVCEPAAPCKTDARRPRGDASAASGEVDSAPARSVRPRRSARSGGGTSK